MRDSLDYPGAWARGSASSSDDKPEQISRVVRPLFTSRGPGFRVQHLDGAVLGTSIDPWLAIDRFWMSRPTFPPHPHAGFSAITYVMPESAGVMRNRDSAGGRHKITPGGLHWTSAGSGILHEEIPATDQPVEGLQIFLNHPMQRKHDKPVVHHLEPGDIPIICGSDGSWIRVLAGGFRDRISPIATTSPVTLLDIWLAPFARFDWYSHDQPANLAVVHQGELMAATATADAGEVVLPNGDGSLYLAATGNGARLVLFCGTPIREPVHWVGPLCMASEEDAYRALVRYRTGLMGSLQPYRRGLCAK
jgi:hypothetical protein